VPTASRRAHRSKSHKASRPSRRNLSSGRVVGSVQASNSPPGPYSWTTADDSEGTDMRRIWLLAGIAVAAFTSAAAVAGGGTTTRPSVPSVSRWWWTQEWAAQQAVVHYGGDSPYWQFACAGIGSHRYYDVAAAAVGPGGQTVGRHAPGVTSSTWKWQHFRCLRLRNGGWTTFELYVLGSYAFEVAPPRGTGHVLARTIVFR
jgi:hypothetical protein